MDSSKIQSKKTQREIKEKKRKTSLMCKRQEFSEALAGAYAELRANPKDWNEEKKERRLYESSEKSTKAKSVTITLPSNLVTVIDNYIENHNADRVSRSSVIEEGVKLWLQSIRDKRDLDYFTRNAKALKADNKYWSKISSKAAKDIFK